MAATINRIQEITYNIHEKYTVSNLLLLNLFKMFIWKGNTVQYYCILNYISAALIIVRISSAIRNPSRNSEKYINVGLSVLVLM